ncbi:hypothetical protein N7517_002677 [Penicillium concentricum]|uniref:Uncharacterized protein n=1 Tax=Penicillium concentricum TaxID=293559 RepID=A0A9W9SU51_9EURO|nr:uncharacterized protein N7517_002677 [Penicillium concentricum]KAJ5384766.1 hypothetical protein N7517_002677 [Penicillium concentricum]
MDVITVFVARASVEEATDQSLTRDRLHEFLNPVVQSYETTSGRACLYPRFYTFIHDSDRPLRSGGSALQYFANLLSEGQDKCCDVIIVLNGWDALTVDKMTFVRLFGRVSIFDIDVKVKVFASHTKSTTRSQFFDINPSAACAILTGELDPTTEIAPNDDTQLFISTMETISADIWQQGKFFAFIHGPNEAWCPRARHTMYMMDLVAEATSLSCPVLLIISGWSGLTNCPLMCGKIFGWFGDAGAPVMVRVYADTPRRFFDVDPQQVKAVLRGDITPGESGEFDKLIC